MLDRLFRNVRYSLRALGNARGFTSIAVLTLGLGIGSSTAIFSVVHSVLFRPLGYTEPDRLVQVYTEFPKQGTNGLRRFWTSRPEYLELKRDLTSWQTFDAWSATGANIGGGAEPVRVQGARVTGTLLQTLGVRPAKGRLIQPADDAFGAPLTAVLSYSLWQRAFGGDPTLVNREILYNGEKCTVLGIMPADFRFPPGDPDPPEVWIPWRMDPAEKSWSNHLLYMVGRLKPGITHAQASAEMANYVQKTGALATMNSHNLHPVDHPLVSYSFQDEVTRGVRSSLLLLLGAVGFVLLIACVNVANLLLARAEARQREVAVRSALGAGTSRLLAQFVTEGVVLSVFGTLLGFVLAFGGVRLIVSTQAGVLPRAGEIGLHLPTLLFAMALTAFTGVIFGLAPFLHLSRGGTSQSLKSGGGRNTAAGSSLWFRRVLVIGEISLALVLLIGASLMVQAFWRLQHSDPGFSAERVLTMRIALPPNQYPKADDVFSYWDRLLRKVKDVPEVASVSIADGLPPNRPIDANDTQIEGLNSVPGGPANNIDFWNIVTPGYFEEMGIRLLDGRFLDQRDGAGAAPSVVVNQTMAHLYYGNQSALGRRIRPGFQDPWRTIVGVVSDARNAGLDKPAGTEIYMPFEQVRAFGDGLRVENVVVLGTGDPGALAGPVRAAIRSLDPSIPVARVRTMEDILHSEQARPRFLSLVLALFSALALLLAAVGLYGVISYSVAQRTGEFGIRIAIGASATNVQGIVLKEGLLLGLLGVALGMAAATLLTRFIQSLLFGVQASDPWTFGLMAAALVAVVLVASFFPARRATRVDPLVALRAE
jgi:putative ABC transport system permease protein